MAALPRLVCLKSVKNNNYLKYKNDETQTRGLVQFTGQLMDPYAQFEVVDAKIGKGLVHLKCRYTDSYLVRWSSIYYWISASASEPEEDETNWACTLFKPIVVEDTKDIRLLHVQLGRYVRLQNGIDDSPPFASCMLAASKDPDNQNSYDLLTVVDWASVFKLPKRVAFKGDNGLYLGAQLFNGLPGVQFSFKDAKDPKVAHQLFPSPDGTVYIKSEYFEKFWRVGHENWILVDADGPKGTNNSGAMFKVHVVDINVVAFLTMTTTSYIKRLNSPNIGWEESFAAATHALDGDTRLLVVDLDK